MTLGWQIDFNQPSDCLYINCTMLCVSVTNGCHDSWDNFWPIFSHQKLCTKQCRWLQCHSPLLVCDVIYIETQRASVREKEHNGKKQVKYRTNSNFECDFILAARFMKIVWIVYFRSINALKKTNRKNVRSTIVSFSTYINVFIYILISAIPHVNVEWF